METKSEKLIDLAPQLFNTVKLAQAVLAEWSVPGSTLADKEALTTLILLLNDEALLQKIQEVELPVQHKGYSEQEEEE